MASTTRFCVNLLSLCAILALAGACAQENNNHGFEIRDVRLRAEPRQLNVNFAQILRFSPIALNALEHGVPLTISINMELRDQQNLALLADHQELYEIRYLPLSQRFQLSDGSDGSVRTYPRLRHAVNELSSLRLQFETGPLAPGGYEFRARTRLEKSNLPAPMQLPVLISGKWRHDSDWSSWPFKINA